MELDSIPFNELPHVERRQPIVFEFGVTWLGGKIQHVKTGLHATICRPDLSARQCRSTNRTCILTPDLRPIRENDNRPDSKNLLKCNRFLSSRADTFKEASVSIKFLSKEHAYKTEAIKMADGKDARKSKARSFEEREISLLIRE